MSLLDPLGIFDGGGASSSASVASSVSLDIKGLDKIGVAETIELKPLEIRPLSITQNDTITLSPVEIKPITVNENVDLKPLTVTENIDLKPVAVDSCQTLRLAPLPETTVRNPYNHHVALSLFGLELLALTFNGESEQEICSPHRPRTTERTRYREAPEAKDRGVLGRGRGIRIRVTGDNEA